MKPLKAAAAAVIILVQLWLTPARVSFADVGNTGCAAAGNQKLDIMFVLDITGSMDGKVQKFHEQALDIMLEMSSANSETRFGVACVADYPGHYSWHGYTGTYGTALSEPFRLVHGLDFDIYSVNEAAAGIEPVDGWDVPESYTRALYELGQLEIGEGSRGWRKDARKLVIFIGDAWTHDLSFAGMNSGGDPGRDAIAGTADDLAFCAVVHGLKDKGITVHAINCDDNKYSRATMKGMSEGYGESGGTGGSYTAVSDMEQLYNITVSLLKSLQADDIQLPAAN